MGIKTKKEAEEQLKATGKGKNWLTEAEAAVFLSVSPATLRKWRETGQNGNEHETPPPCYKRGKHYYYSISDLDLWIRGGIAYYPIITDKVENHRGRGHPRKDANNSVFDA